MGIPKVTVAVPIYNTPNDYLKMCIDSIRNQTLKDIEILLISDNTNLDNLLLIHSYKIKDQRIRVIYNNQNMGIAMVRNQCLEEAKGEYLCFVDADDWIDADICESAYKKAKKYGAEIVMWTYQTCINGTIEMQIAHIYDYQTK